MTGPGDRAGGPSGPDPGTSVTSPEAGERPFLSIGEVLHLLRDEFPDVTISKIRFLESQGLLDPERTPSGYRKFYEADVERLRWILQQQKENFLPLKVIKGRLEAEGTGADVDTDAGPAAGTAPAEVAPGPTGPSAPVAGVTQVDPDPVALTQPRPPQRGAVPAALTAADAARQGPLSPELTSTSLTRDELLAASGLSAEELADLERYSLVAGRPVAGQVYFDGDELIVARVAAAFARYGVEGRHLRMFRTAADREAGFYEQLVIPMIKQRNPAARRQAVEALAELAGLGERLRAALLRTALREHTEGR